MQIIASQGWLISAVACDIMITCVLTFIVCAFFPYGILPRRCYLLIRSKFHRLKSSIELTKTVTKTAGMLSKLMLYTVQTGLVTSVTALVELALFIAAPNENVYFLLCVFMPVLISSSLTPSPISRSHIFVGRL
jgi:hypothetical protein